MSNRNSWHPERPLLRVVTDDEPTLRSLPRRPVELDSAELIDDEDTAAESCDDSALDALIQTHEVIRDLDDLKETLLRCDDEKVASVRAAITDALAARLVASTEALTQSPTDGAPARPRLSTRPPAAVTEREESLAHDVRRLRQAVVALSMMLVLSLVAVATTAVAWTTSQDSAAAQAR